MGYTLTAMISIWNSPKTPDEIDLVSFGIYDTEVMNFKDAKVNATAVETIRAKFNGMMAKTPTQSKPLTFSWFPLSEKKAILSPYKGKKLDLRLVVIDNDNKSRLDWAFEQVELKIPRPEFRDFPGNFKRQDERYDATFIKFKDK